MKVHSHSAWIKRENVWTDVYWGNQMHYCIMYTGVFYIMHTSVLYNAHWCVLYNAHWCVLYNAH